MKSFTQDPSDFFSYETVYSQNGEEAYHFSNPSSRGERAYISRVEEISTREQADALKNQKIFVKKAQLPLLNSEDEYYYVDLVGLRVLGRDDQELGWIVAVHNFGAGDILEVKREGDNKETVLLPFTKEFFPEVSLQGSFARADIQMLESYLAEEGQP